MPKSGRTLRPSRQPARPRRIARAVAALLSLACVGSAGAISTMTTVLVSDLNNPRGLSFGPDGALYIAEAGVASGSGPSTVVRGDPLIVTSSGSVARYAGGSYARLYTGLASNYNANTNEVSGPNDIVFDAAGQARIAVGLGFDPTLRSGLGALGASLGQLLTPGVGSVDLGAFEAGVNPGGGPLDSNPWHLARTADATLVTDAGANALLRVRDAGGVETVATFGARSLGGPFPTESVPTGIAVAPDGSFYVGELTGFPFIPGAARVFHVLADGTSTLFASGFTNIVDLAFGADGSLFVLEYDTNGLLNPGDAGALWRIATDGTRSLVASDGLSHPTGLAIGADGAFYLSNFGGSSGSGQLVRLAIPEPGVPALLLAALGGTALVGRARRRRR